MKLKLVLPRLEPEEDKTPVPQGVLAVKLLRKGSKRFWTDHFIQNFIESTADKAKLQVNASRPGQPLKPVDFAPLIRDWATRYGFTPEEAKAQVENWAAEVKEAPEDFYRLGLAAFADRNFVKASELLLDAARNSEQQLVIINKQKEDLEAKRLNLVQQTIRNYKRAGDAHYVGYAFADALAAYEKALGFVDHRAQSGLWAQLCFEVGLANAELGNRTEGSVANQHLSNAVRAYHSALEVYSPGQWGQEWAMTQNSLGNALLMQGQRSAAARGRELLAQAIAAYSSALDVYTREVSPEDWAMTQNNLGDALLDEGLRATRGIRPPTDGRSGICVSFRARGIHTSTITAEVGGGAEQYRKCSR